MIDWHILWLGTSREYVRFNKALKRNFRPIDKVTIVLLNNLSIPIMDVVWNLVCLMADTFLVDVLCIGHCYFVFAQYIEHSLWLYALYAQAITHSMMNTTIKQNLQLFYFQRGVINMQITWIKLCNNIVL